MVPSRWQTLAASARICVPPSLGGVSGVGGSGVVGDEGRREGLWVLLSLSQLPLWNRSLVECMSEGKKKACQGFTALNIRFNLTLFMPIWKIMPSSTQNILKK